MPVHCLGRYLLLALVVASGAAFAAGQDADIEGLLASARAQHLAADAQWLALLHVNRGGTLRDRGRSYVDDRAFFLAPQGNADPAAEFAATIRALFAADAEIGDGSARCRFVARYRWLAMRLQQPVADLRSACPAYGAWRAPINATRVTLVFPGSYLNSPSSMFGHTLLRLDPPAETASTVWLSQAVSFGADVRAADNSMLYIWKGLAGGYPGHFQVEPYFAKIQQYGRMENRDLWEYPLDLAPAEAELLVDHLWEVRETNFEYYFFDENCSYRLLELLEVARPSLTLTRAWRFSEVPVNTIRSVHDAGISTSPLLRPSAERELRARITQLAARERDIALALAADAAATTREDFRALPHGRQAMILATAYANMVYHSRKDVGRDPLRAQRSLELLRALNSLDSNPQAKVPAVAAPETGHRTRRISLGGGVIANGGLDGDARGNYTTIALRPTYHDLLDPVRGYLPGAELEMLDTELRVNGAGNIKLERLDVANVFSLTPQDRFFRNVSWRVRGGIERQMEEDLILHSTRYVEGGGGVAWRVGDVFARAYAETRIEHSGAHEHLVDIAVGPALGLLGQHRFLNWSLDARPLYFSGGLIRTEARAALQWQPGRDWGVRAEMRWRQAEAGAADKETTDAQIVLHRYF